MPFTGAPQAPPLVAFTAQWVDLWRQAASFGQGSVAATFLYDPRQVRSWWLADLTRSTDRYLRSSAFLELLRSTLTAMTRTTELLSPIRLK